MKSTHNIDALLDESTRIVREAGAIALSYFRHGERTSAAVDYKHGNSPVTEADLRVDAFLREKLATLAPEAGWLSEETADNDDRLDRRRVWIVDPIDGTRGFVAGDARWCVSAALVEAGRPILGLLHLPALGQTYVAAAGRGARRDGEPLKARSSLDPGGPLIAGPPGFLRELAGLGHVFRAEPRIPSLAYRLARVADGSLDAGVASTNARDWDIAAADIILREAGAGLCDLEGREIVYNRRNTAHGVLLAAPNGAQAALAVVLRQAVEAHAASRAAERKK